MIYDVAVVGAGPTGSTTAYITTKKGLKTIGIGISSGSSLKAGGELHRALLFKAREWLENQGYKTKIPEQCGREEQPDMIAQKEEREIAVEVETTANHPEQIIKNYEKNVKQGRFVIEGYGV